MTAACTSRVEPPPPDFVVLSPVSFHDLPGWNAGRQAGALSSLRRSCENWLRRPADARAGGAVQDLRAGMFHPPCQALAALRPGDHVAARHFLERWFAPFAVAGRNGKDGLFTGYFEPEIAGSLQKSRRFSVPIYARPRDLSKSQGSAAIRYHDRRQIEAGALDGAARPLAWAADPVDVFFLQIQGSGRVRLPDGKILRLGFDGHNGHPYTSIGGVLVRRGALDLSAVSMQSIRAWLAANPMEVRPVLNSNARYVFFRRLTGPGPIGADNVPLTPDRSLAVDRRLIPFGAPVWLDTSDALDGARKLRRLMVAQDTGGAIKGAVRGDIFFGAGPGAAEQAGRMNRSGRYFLLLPRDAFPAS